jgi:hypothetical protein
MYTGMNDIAYDISHLFESEMIELDGSHFRTSTAPTPVACKTPDLLALQERMARELLQAADAHEALIQQYLRVAGDIPFDSYAA